MKLGTETASLTNYLLSGTDGQPEPYVGMGVTFLSWTDRYAGTIHSVRTKNGVAIEFDAAHDKSVMVSGSMMSESQGYEFTPNPEAIRDTYRRDRKGQWRRIGFKFIGEREVRGFVDKGQCIRLGERDEYRDPSF